MRSWLSPRGGGHLGWQHSKGKLSLMDWMRSLILGSLTNINSEHVDIISVQCYGTDPALSYPCPALSFQLLYSSSSHLRPFMFFLTVQRAIRKARKKKRKRKRNTRNTRRRKTKNTKGRLTAAHLLPLLLGRLGPTLFGGALRKWGESWPGLLGSLAE